MGEGFQLCMYWKDVESISPKESPSTCVVTFITMLSTSCGIAIYWRCIRPLQKNVLTAKWRTLFWRHHKASCQESFQVWRCSLTQTLHWSEWCLFMHEWRFWILSQLDIGYNDSAHDQLVKNVVLTNVFPDVTCCTCTTSVERQALVCTLNPSLSLHSIATCWGWDIYFQVYRKYTGPYKYLQLYLTMPAFREGSESKRGMSFMGGLYIVFMDGL